MKTATILHVRPMRHSDIPQVIEIERESFPTIWPPTAFRRELQQNRLAHYIVVTERNPKPTAAAPPRHGPVGRILGEVRHMLHGDNPQDLPAPEDRPELVAGFVGMWLMADEAHIVTIATRESHRRRGIGERLLIAAIELAQQKHQPLVTLEVRVSNGAAIALYEKYGFEEVGRRPRYYSDNREDALIFTASAVTSQAFIERFNDLRSAHARRWEHFGEQS